MKGFYSRNTPDAKFEREFLIRLAPVWLSCKLRLQHPAADYHHDPVFTFMGLMDYQAEMSLICRERLNHERQRATA